MSTWQIFPDDRNDFLWENAVQQLRLEEFSPAVAEDSRRFPSMADLLLLGSSKLLENGKSYVEEQPTFRTGLGKSVELKQSSIARARSVLGELDYTLIDSGHLDGREKGSACFRPISNMNSIESAVMSKSVFHSASKNDVHMKNSMFQTGLGKTVSISSAGLHRAKALLGLDGNCDQEQRQKQSISSELLSSDNPSHLDTQKLSKLNFSSSTKAGAYPRVKSSTHPNESMNFPECMTAASELPQVKFQTAVGRSISVSSDALQRAKSLLGNLEVDSFLNEASTANPLFSVIDGKPSCLSNQKDDFTSPFLHHQAIKNGGQPLRKFSSPPSSSSYKRNSFGKSERLQPGNNLIAQFDAEAEGNSCKRHYNGFTVDRKPPKKKSCSNMDGLEFAILPKSDPSKVTFNTALVDISNTMNIDNKQYSGEKKRLRGISSVSPFKKPRSSFVTPLKKTNLSDTNVLSRPAPKESPCKQRVSLRYPSQRLRVYLKEYFSQPPLQEKLGNLPEYVKSMNPIAAESFTIRNETSSECIGPEAFYTMLLQSGASIQHMTKEWVTNHYKWIIWKLTSYERSYAEKFSGKLLTVSSVLEELLYRYEREVNHGHRSLIKKMLDGDVPPSSMMVLCISSVCEDHDPQCGNQSVPQEGGYVNASRIELTDGWYAVKALLDEQLSQKLASKKLFLGQKIRFVLSSEDMGSQTVWVAWACFTLSGKRAGDPLSFRCIKGNGGVVPSTLVRVTRTYPVLYRERSERLEAKALQSFNQRRDLVAEGIMSSFQRETEFDVGDDHEREEGAKLMKLLETAAEPEVLMAGMSSKELAAFASYKAKLEAMRLSEIQKTIEKAVQDAGLGERETTPFLRLKVVSLMKKGQQECSPLKGLVTIWNPTQKQTLELQEGQAYAVGGLSPNIACVDLHSEFDMVALVVYVGEVYRQGHLQKQWVFVTDESAAELFLEGSPDVLLAINFCLPYVEFDSSVPMNSSVSGSVASLVGFSNLTKRKRDQVNGLWVAEATENSDYFLSYDNGVRRHLKDAAASVAKWATPPNPIIEKLKERVLSIIRNPKHRC
ncbi:hypothetical protein SASPL_108790 [Salvia splendens]|uniref:Uncharacterized protein n=1 Tax=Salvia splendens TaxID=180675 RepID=A0A8X8YDQ9_SALSN|nr:hypothetical protein SASPL_108790 [Salvia splendens]